MNSDFNDIIKDGYVKIRAKHTGTWKRKWVVLRKSSSKGPLRIEKYTEEKFAILGGDCKTIPLTNVISIARVPVHIRKCALSIAYTNSKSRLISCGSDEEVQSWLTVLTDNCTLTSELDSDQNQESKDRFFVSLVPNPLLKYNGECILHIAKLGIRLLDVDTQQQLVKWPFNAIRKYGCKNLCFTFESGRHCETGVGLFVLTSYEAEAISRSVYNSNLALIEEKRAILNRTRAAHGSGEGLHRNLSMEGTSSVLASGHPGLKPVFSEGATRRRGPQGRFPIDSQSPPVIPPRVKCVVPVSGDLAVTTRAVTSGTMTSGTVISETRDNNNYPYEKPIDFNSNHVNSSSDDDDDYDDGSGR